MFVWTKVNNLYWNKLTYAHTYHAPAQLRRQTHITHSISDSGVPVRLSHRGELRPQEEWYQSVCTSQSYAHTSQRLLHPCAHACITSVPKWFHTFVVDLRTNSRLTLSTYPVSVGNPYELPAHRISWCFIQKPQRYGPTNHPRWNGRPLRNTLRAPNETIT